MSGFQAYWSSGFTEKPDKGTAIEFLISGLYYWNSGMFMWRADHIMAEFARQQPDMHRNLEAIAQAIGQDNYSEILEHTWPEMKKLSIDYAVMEGAENITVIPGGYWVE